MWKRTLPRLTGGSQSPEKPPVGGICFPMEGTDLVFSSTPTDVRCISGQRKLAQVWYFRDEKLFFSPFLRCVDDTVTGSEVMNISLCSVSTRVDSKSFEVGGSVG